VVRKNHDCRQHRGEPVNIGRFTVYAGGIHLSKQRLAETDVLVTLCDRPPLNLGSEKLRHLRFPMPDFGGIPLFLGTFLKIHVLPALADGLRVTFHCEGGFGRTGSALAALVALLETEVEDPTAAIRKRYCPGAVETPAQEAGIIELRNAARAANQGKGEIMSVQDPTDKWYMAGTEGTGEYHVIAKNNVARLGIRPVGSSVRIRIEPAGDKEITALADSFTVEAGWKQPDMSQQRFSRFLPKNAEATQVVVDALKVLEAAGDKLERNSAARLWRRHIA